MLLYDAVEVFGSEVAFAGLSGQQFQAFEHGTIRWAAKRETSIQKLTMRGYRAASGTFISNGDCVNIARENRLPRTTPTVHPLVAALPSLVDQAESFAREILTGLNLNEGPYLLCPLRHDWEVKGTDLYIRALPELARLLNGRITVIFTRWGKQVEESAALIEELGVEASVRWIEPQGRQILISLMKSSLCVLDQTVLPCFGSTGPQALAYGVPVLASYVASSTFDICETAAPILPVFTANDIVAAVSSLTDPTFHAEVTAASLAWAAKWHSIGRLIEDQECALRSMALST